MGSVSLDYTVTLILSLIMILSAGGCVYKAYRVNCDPQSIDEFNKFNTLFGNCVNNNCGEFNFKDIPEGHKIVLESNEMITNVRLNCGGRFNTKNTKVEESYNIGLCTFIPPFGDIKDIDKYEIYSEMGSELRLIKKENKICFSLIGNYWDSPGAG